MDSLNINQLSLDLRARRMLLADWFGQLAAREGLNLTQYGTSGNAYTLGSPNEFNIRADFIDEEPYLRFVPSDSSRDELIATLESEAAARVQAGDFGGEVWYSTELHEITFNMNSPQFMSDLLLRLGNQTRILGWRRLGSNVLLDFAEERTDEEDGKTTLFAPKAIVKVHIAAPGPQHGHFASFVAHSVLEIVGAICTFALGRPVNLPYTIFPAEEEHWSSLTEQRTNREVYTLARKSVPLDIFGWIAHPGGLQVFERLRSALLSFDAAVKQDHDAIACILYVVAAECLTTPPTPWRKEKLTKRFREFYDELMPDLLDELVRHNNFEEAIGIRRGSRTTRALRREALDRIYSFRSGQLHEGLLPAYSGFTPDFAAHTRRGLFNDFAEGAILRFITAPRTSLIGHPSLSEPGADATSCGTSE